MYLSLKPTTNFFHPFFILTNSEWCFTNSLKHCNHFNITFATHFETNN